MSSLLPNWLKVVPLIKQAKNAQICNIHPASFYLATFYWYSLVRVISYLCQVLKLILALILNSLNLLNSCASLPKAVLLSVYRIYHYLYNMHTLLLYNTIQIWMAYFGAQNCFWEGLITCATSSLCTFCLTREVNYGNWHAI